MAKEKEERHDTYIIPPNFIEGGTVRGGMFKLRNAIEAGAAALLLGFPVFRLPLTLTIRIVLMCLTALSAGAQRSLRLSGASQSDPAYQMQKLNQFYSLLGMSYVDTINYQQLTENAIREVLSQLDPHSAYISSEEMKRVNESFSGSFSGIGIEFNVPRPKRWG